MISMLSKVSTLHVLHELQGSKSEGSAAWEILEDVDGVAGSKVQYSMFSKVQIWTTLRSNACAIKRS